MILKEEILKSKKLTNSNFNKMNFKDLVVFSKNKNIKEFSFYFKYESDFVRGISFCVEDNGKFYSSYIDFFEKDSMEIEEANHLLYSVLDKDGVTSIFFGLKDINSFFQDFYYDHERFKGSVFCLKTCFNLTFHNKRVGEQHSVEFLMKELNFVLNKPFFSCDEPFFYSYMHSILYFFLLKKIDSETMKCFAEIDMMALVSTIKMSIKGVFFDLKSFRIEESKYRYKFVKNILDNISCLSYVHPKYSFDSSSTYRITARSPSIQSISKKTGIRRFFIPRTSDNLFIKADYSQVQLRIIAHLSVINGITDGGFLNSINNNIDIHQLTANFLGKDREFGKKINFSACFGIGVKRLSEVLGISQSECKILKDKWSDRFHECQRLHDLYLENLLRDGFVQFMGYRRTIEIRDPNDPLGIYMDGWRAFSSVCQMVESVLIKNSIVSIDRELLKRGLDANIIMVIHDELIVECNKKDEEEISKIILTNMKTSLDLEVPIEVNIKTGKNWMEVSNDS